VKELSERSGFSHIFHLGRKSLPALGQFNYAVNVQHVAIRLGIEEFLSLLEQCSEGAIEIFW
jgi:hypothetical protein